MLQILSYYSANYLDFVATTDDASREGLCRRNRANRLFARRIQRWGGWGAVPPSYCQRISRESGAFLYTISNSAFVAEVEVAVAVEAIGSIGRLALHDDRRPVCQRSGRSRTLPLSSAQRRWRRSSGRACGHGTCSCIIVRVVSGNSRRGICVYVDQAIEVELDSGVGARDAGAVRVVGVVVHILDRPRTVG